jgi:hypothetical protein
MWERWKIGESQNSFSVIIQHVKEIQQDHGRDGKINFNMIRIYYPTIIFACQNIHLESEQSVKLSNP